jgi:uncharacterized protein
MLKNSFIQIPGITPQIEAELWKNNILSWSALHEKHQLLSVSRIKKQRILSNLNQSMRAYDDHDLLYFANRLPLNHHWRAYPELKDNCCFLDIETTGLSRTYNDITLIGLYDGKKSRFFVNGKNLNEFPEAVKDYPMIVTFNGRCFDIPFIQAKFPKLSFDKFHVDLRFAMRDLGYRGGLKRIEREIGLSRDDDIAEVDGFEAVRLWHRYKQGDKNALELLIRYNQADIENLKTMMEFAFENLKKRSFSMMDGLK